MWKKMPYWLKGGIISLLIPILLYITYYISEILKPPCTGLMSCFSDIFDFPAYILLIYLPVYLIMYPFDLINGGYPGDMGDKFMEVVGPVGTYVTVALFYFLAGALIGWIVGKIKAWRKNKQE